MVKGDGLEVWAPGAQCHPLCLHQTFGEKLPLTSVFGVVYVVCVRMRACETEPGLPGGCG